MSTEDNENVITVEMEINSETIANEETKTMDTKKKEPVVTVEEKKIRTELETYRKRENRDELFGLETRKKMRTEANDLVKRIKEKMKAKDPKDENKDEFKKEFKEAKKIAREFGRIDEALVIDGVLHLGISVAGGAIAGKLTDGDYLKAILPNLAGCTTVDATAAVVEKYITGQIGEGWKKWTFRTIKFGFRTGGAAGIAAGTSYLLEGDMYTAAVTAGGTQVARIVLEKGLRVIEEWE